MSDKLLSLEGASPTFPGTWTKTHTFGQWTGLAPLNLMLPSVRFVHALTYHEIDSIPADNKFHLNISFLPIDTNKFNIIVSSPYSNKVNALKLSMFIYDQAAFASIKINIRDAYQVVPPFATGPSLQHFTTGGWLNYPGMTALTGIAGYEFNTATFGFDMRLDITTTSDILTLTVENLMASTIAIPKLDVMYITITQAKCPNNEPLVDQALTTCMTSCPVGYNPSTTPVPYLGLYTC